MALEDNIAAITQWSAEADGVPKYNILARLSVKKKKRKQLKTRYT